ncbi:MAG: HNH endonuclease [Bacteroidetes bacterium]|nr:HNH endonuclease [Bacteroidota bacterium]
MKSQKLNTIIEKSKINYDYKTIRVTKSRIEKGLLAIPRNFSNYLPKSSQKIKIYFDDSENPLSKTFSSFYSSTNENRIGGLKDWFYDNQIREDDELVLQVIDKNKFIYRLFKEKKFIERIKEIQADFDNSKDDKIVFDKIELISNLTKVDKTKIVYNEFLRLANYSNEKIRKRLKISNRFSRENIPPSIRVILGYMYKGRCQVCSFTFFKRDRNPYYEIHHLDATLGHHPKNLVLVCANCHRQFEYANVSKDFDETGWLSKVTFNQNNFKIKQAVKEIEKQVFLKSIYI